MALVEAAVCPAGHPQTYTRSDRPGRCTRCGSTMVRGVYDDTVLMGKAVAKPGSTDVVVVPDEEGA